MGEKITACAYNSFLWAMAVACTLFGNEWLEMRVNMAYILLGVWVALFVAAWQASKAKKRRVSLPFSAVNSVLCVGYSLFLLGPKRFCVVPAAIVREGLHLRRAPFFVINAVLLAVLLLAFSVLCFMEVRYRKQKINQ